MEFLKGSWSILEGLGTNDLVRVHPDKTVEFIGRIGNYVKLGGAFHDISSSGMEDFERELWGGG